MHEHDTGSVVVDVPVTPQNGAALEGAGADSAASAVHSGRAAAAESKRDRLWTDRLLLQGHMHIKALLSSMLGPWQ